MEQWMQDLNHSISDMKQTLLLRTSALDNLNVLEEPMLQLNSMLSEMERMTQSFRSQLDKEEEDLLSLKVVQQQLQQQNILLQDIKSKLPKHLPGKTVAPELQPNGSGNIAAKASTPVMNKSSSQEKKSPQDSSSGRFVAYLTIDEVASVPKYIVGRLNQDQINEAIEELNSILKWKYDLYPKKKGRHYTKSQKDLLMEWEENARDFDDLSAKHWFITTKELHSRDFRLDSKGRQVMGVLRHLHRIREERSSISPGAIRYVVL